MSSGESPAPTIPETHGSDLPKQYRPADHEPRAWAQWIDAGAFHADPDRVLRGEAKPYCILIPPPNVTAALHLGHALNNTIQDILARAHRMKGFETLWMPGTDHAGIATQAVVEKRLRKEGKLKGPLKVAMPRDEFVAHVQAFKDEYEAVITGQLKAMGCSCDWDRQRFTMDEVCARAVREAFFRLFKDGLIYRGKRLVNWDPALQTAVADDECYDEEVDTSFWYLRYPLVHAHGPTTAKERAQGKPPPDDAVPVTWSELASRGYPGAEDHPAEDPAWVTVATTRPETYLGDTAVAVNPHDPRAKALRGLSVELPLVGRVIPIVEDAYVVLPKAMARGDEETNDPKAEFATGFLKVTPAHDANDAEIALRHNLPAINMMSPDGRVSDTHGWSDVGDAHLFVGKSMPEARKLVVREFEARGLLEATRPYRHSVKHSDRSKAAIEPYLSDQWYVKVTDPRLAAAANAALVPEQRTGGTASSGGTALQSSATKVMMRFYPARYAKSFEHWHDNIRDWCISRQLWWGHRIPVWHRRITIAKGDSPEAGEVGAAGLDHLIRAEYPGGSIRVHDASGNVVNPAELLRTDAHADRTLDVFVCYDGREPLDAKRLESHGFSQDPDVLDTWFSSGLWPLSTMGWPDPAQANKDDPRSADFEKLLAAFNPSTALCTAREIITLWVSRMTMFNRYFMPALHEPRASARGLDLNEQFSAKGSGPVPFRDVFIHAVIQDGEGRKMSKSLGNGVDPLDIIATHGSDAMRFTLCHMATNTQDVRLPVRKDSATGKNTSEKFDLGRNFTTKLWNAARFTLGILDKTPADPAKADWSKLSLTDRWMLSRLAAAAAEIDRALANYEFSAYATALYDVTWRDFCDWYVEAIKGTVEHDPAQRCVLAAALDTILRLAHPVMPFVTETIYQHWRSRHAPVSLPMLSLAPARKEGTLCTAGWPEFSPRATDPAAVAEFERLREVISAIREVRAQHKVLPKRRITLHAPAAAINDLGHSASLVQSLAGLEAITPNAPSGPAAAFNAAGHEWLLANLADAVDAGAEKDRLSRQAAELRRQIGILESRLGNPGYADKAPPHMVQQSRDQLAKLQAELAGVLKGLEGL